MSTTLEREHGEMTALMTEEIQAAPGSSQDGQNSGPGTDKGRDALAVQGSNGGSRQSPRKPKRPRKDNEEYLTFARRILRGYGRRVQAEDPSTLGELCTLRAELDAVIAASARSLQAQGYSWSEIGEGCGISKHAAMKRWAGPAADES